MEANILNKNDTVYDSAINLMNMFEQLFMRIINVLQFNCQQIASDLYCIPIT